MVKQLVMKLRAQANLNLAQRSLAAWGDSTDWADLPIYGFYCLEQAVMAAATEFGLRGRKQHREGVQLASRLHRNKGLPDVTSY
jgi:hypothetical protein